MGWSTNWVRALLVFRCRVRYAGEPGAPYTQRPPTRSADSKQTAGTPTSASALRVASPAAPAPMTATRGCTPIAGSSPLIQRALDNGPARAGTSRRGRPVQSVEEAVHEGAELPPLARLRPPAGGQGHHVPVHRPHQAAHR